MSALNTDWRVTIALIEQGIYLHTVQGWCAPGCATGDHGECNDGDCRCLEDGCVAYRQEWFA